MSKSLVTYFSASGVTKRLAEKLAKEIGAVKKLRGHHMERLLLMNWLNIYRMNSLESGDLIGVDCIA